MEFDLTGGEYLARAYKLLAGLVTPRPIAWVTTINRADIKKIRNIDVNTV